MTAKEQKIKEAWIAEIREEKYNVIQSKINNDGSVNAWHHSPTSLGIEDYEMVIKGIKHYTYRPKSLQGIEDNKGWNRIDEVGLPSEEGEFIAGRLSDGGFITYYQLDLEDVIN